MIEKLVANWLTKASEREFQHPFAFLLSAQGYNVLHLTRHCAMELGKDILAIGPDGTECAFQLKGVGDSGRISLSQWRNELNSQLLDLAILRIDHPRFTAPRHKSFLVINGQLSEEAAAALNRFNEGLVGRGLADSQVSLIQGADLVSQFCELQRALWPPELPDVSQILSLYQADGREPLDREKFSAILGKVVCLDADVIEKPSDRSMGRASGAAALLVSFLTSKASDPTTRNHYHEIEAWLIYITSVVGMCERWSADPRIVASELQVAESVLWSKCADLLAEVNSHPPLTSPDPLLDSAFGFLRYRKTVVSAIVACIHFHDRENGDCASGVDQTRNLLVRNASDLFMWGEAAIPQLLAVFWALRKICPGQESEELFRNVVAALASSNREGSDDALLSPYYTEVDAWNAMIDDVEPFLLGEEVDAMSRRRVAGVIEDRDGRSYMIDAILMVAARNMSRACIEQHWDSLSRIDSLAFESATVWERCTWRSRNGTNMTKLRQPRQSWSQLVSKATSMERPQAPSYFLERPSLFLLFCIVFPHRFDAQSSMFLDAAFQ